VSELAVLRSVPRRGGRGFTLIELLVAIAILAMAAGGVMAVFAAATRSHARAVHGTEAAVIATGLVAEARAEFRESGGPAEIHDAKVPGKRRYTYDRECYPLDVAGDEVLLRIRIRWARRGRETHLDFDTIIFRKAE
jgi:type II secretion system protein I